MARFWIGLAFLLLLIPLSMVIALAVVRNTDIGIPIARQMTAHAITALLLTALWAVCFRPIIQNGRVSLFSLFALVTIQAVGAWLARFIHFL